MDIYENPLIEKYSSYEMLYNFSPKKKIITWRKLWLYLAKIEKSLGVNITNKQIKDLQNNLLNINFDRIKFYENKFHHDVIAHIYAYGELAKIAKPIIHLGATSAYVVDNTDLIQIRDGLNIILKKIIKLISSIKFFALKYKNLPTIGYTHYQPALLTTVGKRATLWLQSIIFDLEELEFRLKNLKFRGIKGAIGTANSFKQIFNGDYNKVKILEKKISKIFGFNKIFYVTGQTYDRKIDVHILQLMSNIAQSAHKFTNDIRLLQNLKELEEPFAKDQLGSSAMPYKKNPILSERISSLSKYVISLTNSVVMVSASQWLERTLDDSANKKISIPQSFLAIDAILDIWNNIINGIKIYPKIIEKHIKEEIPFFATENIMIEEVKKGNDRQNIHKKIRNYSINVINQIKNYGKKNNLLSFILNDKDISINQEELKKIINPKEFIGFANEQTIEFIDKEINPILKKYQFFK